ncbi:MAG: nucleoside triphosphate pyrophosphohydrolase [Calditrichaeota bacterium]|nr:nucleoside triphosphate pyrophosphohydrolase [Calditrichota bacterium]
MPYVPPSPEDAIRDVVLPEGESLAVEQLIKVMARLRAPDGCPWDRAQTFQSLLPNLLEETYEYLHAVREDDPAAMREELGDLFLQVIFHAQIAAEAGLFDLGSAARELTLKLIRRHPHVFGDDKAETPDHALESWNNSKRREGSHTIQLEKIPRAMPALLRARKIQEKSARVGFEWPDVSGAMQKIDEELQELKAAIAGNAIDNDDDDDKWRDSTLRIPHSALDEVGDLLFAVVNVARYLKVDPETALNATNEKFIRRFRVIEDRLRERGRTMEETSLSEMDAIWEEAKSTAEG